MTRHLTTVNLSDFITSLTPFTVGMDRMFRDLEQFSNSFAGSSTAYPPYNIEQIDEGKWVISMAIAGFGEEDIKVLQAKIKKARGMIQEIMHENERRATQNTRIQVIQEQTQEFETELNSIETELEKNSAKLANLDILKRAFSTSGLIAYKIENLVKDLEDMTNDYLAELSDGRFSINFVVNNDKLNVEITDNGKTVAITALSSGELTRVNTATLIAIRKLMSSISKSRINVLFLDEVINVLDEAGREKLVEILLKEKDLNTYVVSHGWTHPLLEKIEVIKENNISRLE